MGRYESPPNPYDEFETGCIRVYFPDSPFLFRALMGQLTELEHRYVWDTGGDIEAAGKLAQDWLRAGELTRETQDDGCPDTEECQQTIIDLTLQLEQCQNELQELENMEITVNCNCGGGGCCTPYTIPTDPNGNPFPVIPVDPNDPLGDDVPTWDEVTQTPPPTYDDWQSFIDDRCRAANWFVDSYLEMVENSDLAERRLSAGAAVMEVVTLILAALPGPIGDWAGVVVIVKWVTALFRALTAAVDELEDLNDWLQFAADEVAENRQELVCAVYAMSSVEWLEEFFTTFFAGSVSPEMAIAGASTGVIDFIRDLFAPMFASMAARAHNAFVNQNIPESYVPATSCATCATAEGFEYFPVTISAVELGTGSGTSELGYEVSSDGYSMKGYGVANAAGRNFIANIVIVPPANHPTSRYCGLTFTITGPNISTTRVTTYGGTLTSASIFDGTINNLKEGPVHWLRHSGSTYPSNIPGVVEIRKADNLDLDSCAPGLDGIGLGAVSKAAGYVEYEIKDIRFIADLSRPC